MRCSCARRYDPSPEAKPEAEEVGLKELSLTNETPPRLEFWVEELPVLRTEDTASLAPQIR